MERIKWEDFLKTFCSYRQLLRPVLPLCLPLLTLCLPQTGRQAAKAQKAVDQIQGKLKTAENQLNKANSNLSKKDTDFQNAKEAVASSNDKVTSASNDNSAAQAKLAQAQTETNSANSAYQDAVKKDKEQQQKVTDAETNLEVTKDVLDIANDQSGSPAILPSDIENDNSEIADHISSCQYHIYTMRPKLEAAQKMATRPLTKKFRLIFKRHSTFYCKMYSFRAFPPLSILYLWQLVHKMIDFQEKFYQFAVVLPIPLVVVLQIS